MARYYRYSWHGRLLLLGVIVAVVVLSRGVYLGATWLFAGDPPPKPTVAAVESGRLLLVVLSADQDDHLKRFQEALPQMGIPLEIGKAWAWFLFTTRTPASVQEELRPIEGTGDSVFIAEVPKGNSGWLQETQWDWINKRTR